MYTVHSWMSLIQFMAHPHMVSHYLCQPKYIPCLWCQTKKKKNRTKKTCQTTKYNWKLYELDHRAMCVKCITSFVLRKSTFVSSVVISVFLCFCLIFCHEISFAAKCTRRNTKGRQKKIEICCVRFGRLNNKMLITIICHTGEWRHTICTHTNTLCCAHLYNYTHAICLRNI